jgi:hypothetical protein
LVLVVLVVLVLICAVQTEATQYSQLLLQQAVVVVLVEVTVHKKLVQLAVRAVAVATL